MMSCSEDINLKVNSVNDFHDRDTQAVNEQGIYSWTNLSDELYVSCMARHQILETMLAAQRRLGCYKGRSKITHM